MRNFQFTDGLDISIGIVRKHHNTVSDVVFYRIDVPVLRVHVNTTVELDIGLRTSNQPLRFGTVGIGRRIVQPVEDADAPRVGVLKEYFVEPGVDCNGRVNGIRISNVANRRTRHIARPPGILRGGIYGPLLEHGKQIVSLRCGDPTRVGASGLPQAHFSKVGQLLDGNQSS